MSVLSEETQKRILLEQLNGTGRSNATVVDLASRAYALDRRPRSGTAIATGIMRGTIADDIRVTQARKYFDLGMEYAVGIKDKDLEKYLERIPPIPEEYLMDHSYERLTLCESLSATTLCGYAEIDLRNFVEDALDGICALDHRHGDFRNPTWIRAHDGRRNQGRTVMALQRALSANESMLTLSQAICVALQHPDAVSDDTRDGGHAILAGGSRYNHDDGMAFVIRRLGGRIDIGQMGRNILNAHTKRFGVATRRRDHHSPATNFGKQGQYD